MKKKLHFDSKLRYSYELQKLWGKWLQPQFGVATHLALIARVSYARGVSSEWKVSVLSPLALVFVAMDLNGWPCGRFLQSYKSARVLGGYWKHARERPLHNLQSCLETRWQVSLTYHCLSFIAPSSLFSREGIDCTSVPLNHPTQKPWKRMQPRGYLQKKVVLTLKLVLETLN